MSAIKNVVVSPDGDTMSYEMEDGTKTVLETGFKLGGTGGGTGHVMLTLAAALLHAHQRIDALEKERAA